MRYQAINPSILLGHLPLAEQLAVVAGKGFTEIELWWPFDTAAPSANEHKTFLTTLERSGLKLISLNLYEGGMHLGNRGIACWSGYEALFRESVAAARTIGLATGCQLFNVLHGTIDPARSLQDQNALAARNTAYAARVLGDIGGTVTIEQLSHVAHYGLKTGADVIAAIDRAVHIGGASNIKMQVDLFHMHMIGDDILAFFDQYWDRIAHVQVADAPGRGGPGTGSLPLDQYLDRLRSNGYSGRFALEFTGDLMPEDPFAWMKQPDGSHHGSA
ncbi:MAG: hydroxypyruvate isomerase [Homoserinimonas sp.]|nr:hydroxypyruvate isomerase [Homoserinimonas sp.]